MVGGKWLWSAMIVWCLFVAGCGGNEEPAPSAGTSGPDTRAASAQAARLVDDQDGEELIALVRAGDMKVVQEMLAATPKVVKFQRGKDGMTALHEARSREMATLLVEHGADIGAKDRTQNTAIRVAAWRQLWDVAEYLKSKGDGEEDLALACALGDLARVKQLVEADPEAVNMHTRRDDALAGNATMLHVAAYAGRTEVGKYLLDHGADVNAKASWANTEPLETAAWRGHADMVEMLMARGADLEAKDENPGTGWTALGHAVSAGNRAAVEVLVKHGAKVNEAMIKDAARQRDAAKDPKQAAEFAKIAEVLQGAMGK
jgi:ankyrin repeat protein